MPCCTTCRRRSRQLIDSIPDGPTPALSIHGDLHVGQVLRSGDRLVLIDFDGNPLVVDGVFVPQPPVIDVASLVQSVDHVVRMTQHRRQGHDEYFDALAAGISLAAINGYRARLRGLAADSLLDSDLLPALRAVQELHELVYSVRRLPRWSYTPTLALGAMFRTSGRR